MGRDHPAAPGPKAAPAPADTRPGRPFGLLAAAGLMLLTACAPPDVTLPGPREPLRPEREEAETRNRAQPLRLPAPRANADWPQRAGNARNRIRHPALGTAPALLWSVGIGAGNDRRHRITADPVAAGGRIFALDSRARVSALGPDGQLLWQRDLTPPGEDPDDASGGGLAVSGGRLFVTTGFGDLYALAPDSGAPLWRQRLEAPAAGAPTVAGGLVYVSTRDSRGLAIDAETGRVRWQLSGTPSVAGISGGAAPAVGGGRVVFPYSSAQLAAAFPRGGLRIWRASLAGGRPGQAYARLADVTADPVIDRGTVYAGNAAGRTVALRLQDGTRLWNAPEGATGPVWVEDDSLFLVSDRAQLVRLERRSGRRIWAVPLPEFQPARNDRRRRDVYAHFGPVLAGGRLWVASGDGWLRGFDPADGALQYRVALPGGAASRPIVAGETMYLLNAAGQLLAFR